MDETHENMKTILDKIKYAKYEWIICGDLKVLSMLLGQQSGNTKNPCFLCLWDRRAKQDHWIKREWPNREVFVFGENIKNIPLVNREKVWLPPLHIKLGLIKQFAKALDKERESASNTFVQSFGGFHIKTLKQVFSMDLKYNFC